MNALMIISTDQCSIMLCNGNNRDAIIILVLNTSDALLLAILIIDNCDLGNCYLHNEYRDNTGSTVNIIITDTINVSFTININITGTILL